MFFYLDHENLNLIIVSDCHNFTILIWGLLLFKGIENTRWLNSIIGPYKLHRMVWEVKDGLLSHLTQHKKICERINNRV